MWATPPAPDPATQPTDRAWKALLAWKPDPYDPHINKHRARWMAYVRVDQDGCWIWHGPGGNSNDYPRYQIGVTKWTAFKAMIRLWPMPELDLPKGARVWRLCRKPSCVRPGCASTRRPDNLRRRTWPWEEGRRMYESGARIATIAARYGVAHCTVTNVAQKEWGKPRTARIDHNQAMRDWAAGSLTAVELAHRYGVDARVTKRWVRVWESGAKLPSQTGDANYRRKRNRAVQLRSQGGYTIAALTQMLRVPRETVSQWVAGIPYRYVPEPAELAAMVDSGRTVQSLTQQYNVSRKTISTAIKTHRTGTT